MGDDIGVGRRCSFGRLFTFLPPTRASQFSEEMAIDDRPKPMPSPLKLSLTILHKWNNTYIIIIWPFQLQSVVQLINDTSQSFREGKKWKCNSSCGTRSPRGSNSANKVINQRVLTTKPLEGKDLEGCTLCLHILQGCRKVWKSRAARRGKYSYKELIILPQCLHKSKNSSQTLFFYNLVLWWA